jgi:hypothetical protein
MELSVVEQIYKKVSYNKLMRLRTYLIVSFFALMFGVAVVFISFVSFRSYEVSNYFVAGTTRDFYLTRNILPDHLLYPFVMVIDHAQLRLTRDHNDRATLKTGYANNRLESARALFERGNIALAMETTNKSHHYFLDAAELAIENELDEQVVDKIVRFSLHMDLVLEELTDYVSDANLARMNHMRLEQRYMRERL